MSAVNAQVLIRDEMQSRFLQMQSRLAGLKTENDEVCLKFSFEEKIENENERKYKYLYNFFFK